MIKYYNNFKVTILNIKSRFPVLHIFWYRNSTFAKVAVNTNSNKKNRLMKKTKFMTDIKVMITTELQV